MAETKKFYSIPEAAGLSGVSRTTLWGWVKSGYVKALVTPGGHHRIPMEEVDKILTENNKSQSNGRHQKTVLIVDDDPQMQKILQARLSRMDFYAETASDGFEAGIKVIELIPDLVILDLFMPGMDGFEVCRKIKEKKELSHTRILAMSGHDTPENMERIIKLGADGFLPKSSDISIVIRQIEELLRQ
jgi:excisionase family DNA binding protein